MSEPHDVRYYGCIVAFRDGGLSEEEAEEVQNFLLRHDFGGKVSQVTLSTFEPSEAESIARKAVSDVTGELMEFIFRSAPDPERARYKPPCE